MRTLAIIALSTLLLFATGCKKEIKTWTVTYKVVNFEATPASYRVEFTNELGNTQVRGPIDENWWVSPDFIVETGQNLEFLFDLRSGSGDFELFIEVNGSAITSLSVRNPNTPIVLTGTVTEPTEI